MSLGTGTSYYSPALPTSDPFQFAPGLYSRSEASLKFDVSGSVQSGIMYDDRRRVNFTAGASFSSPAAQPFDVRCSPSVNGYEYDLTPPYTRPVATGHSGGQYCVKTRLTSGELGVAYGQGLGRVHSQSIPVNHGGTSSDTALQTGFAIYPWMRSMTAGMIITYYAPNPRGREHYKMMSCVRLSVCLSVCLSVTLLDISRERKRL